MGMPDGERKPEEQRLGPVIRRRGQVQAGTTDQRLLDTEGDSEWVHTDPWRVMRIQSEFVEGFGALAELPSAISVFGSARTPAGSAEYEAGIR
ncbi:TIGR00730 family Rossman fold protein, partial [Streptomyces sp. NPDC056730]